MKRPKRENYDIGKYGDIDYQNRLENYCSYLENKNFPADDEVEEAAEKGAERIFTDTDNGSEWYARAHGFMDGVEWLKNYLTEQPNTKER